MLRSCFALVSCSCLHSAALSVLACTLLQPGSNHTVPDTNWFQSSGATRRTNGTSRDGSGTTTARIWMCGGHGVQEATPFEQHDPNGWTSGFILATGCNTELYDCCVEGEAWNFREQDHNAQNEMLKLFTEHHTNLLMQTCLGEELERVAISCHYAVDCLWEKVAMCGPQERVSTATEHGLKWRRTLK